MGRASLWGEEFSLPTVDKERVIKKATKPKEITIEKAIKSNKVSFEEKLSIVTENVHKILGKYADDTICIYDHDEFVHYIDKCIENGVVAVDTETIGTRTDIDKAALDSFTCKLAGLCLYTPGMKHAYIPVNHMNYYTQELLEGQITEQEIGEQLQRLLNIDCIFHNSKFDYMVLYSTTGVKLPITWDTMIGAQLLNELESASLKFQYRDKIDKEQEKYDIDNLFDVEMFPYYPPELFALYAATDSYETYRLYLYQKQQYEKKGNERLYSLFRDIEMPVVTVVAEMQLRGVAIDFDRGQRLSAKYHKKLDETKQQIASEMEKYKNIIFQWRNSEEANFHPVKNGKKQKSMNEQLADPVELSSPTQLGILLYDVLKVLKVGKDGKKVVDESALESISKTTPLTGLILKQREYEKYLGTYIDKLMGADCINPSDNRLHAKFNQLGREDRNVSTGRMSSSDPNLQNIPAMGDITTVRCMFIPSTENFTRYSFDEIDDAEEILVGDDWVWKNDFRGILEFPVKTRKRFVMIGSDYSAQEVRMFAANTNDPSMLKVFEEGRDLYSEVASMVYKLPYEQCCEFNPITGEMQADGKVRRANCKSLVLGIQYGRGVKSIADQIKSHDGPTTKEDIAEAQKLSDDFFHNYPLAKKWMEGNYKKAEKIGYVEDLWGRRRHLPDASLPPYQFKMDQSRPQIINPLLHTPTTDGIDKNTEQQCLDMLSRAFSQEQRERVYKEIKQQFGIEVTNNNGFIARAQRQSINAPIQGGAATMTKLAMLHLYRDKELTDMDFHLLIPVHDEVIAECPLYYVEQCKKRMTEVMIHAGEPVCKVPMKCDADDFPCWYYDVFSAHVKKEYTEHQENGMTAKQAFDTVCKDNEEFSVGELSQILSPI